MTCEKVVAAMGAQVIRSSATANTNISDGMWRGNPFAQPHGEGEAHGSELLVDSPGSPHRRMLRLASAPASLKASVS
jgi:hypothetical protein